MHLDLQQILDFPQNCILALIDESKKAVYVLYSKKAVYELVKLIDQCNKSEHKCKELEESLKSGNIQLKILKTYESAPSEQQFRAEYVDCVNGFKRAGYIDLRPSFKAANYRLKVRVLEHYNANRRKVPPLVYVIAKSARHDQYVLAIFDNIPQANDWVDHTYGDHKHEHIVPVYADNDLTKGYHALYGVKLI